MKYILIYAELVHNKTHTRRPMDAIPHSFSCVTRKEAIEFLYEFEFDPYGFII